MTEDFKARLDEAAKAYFADLSTSTWATDIFKDGAHFTVEQIIHALQTPQGEAVLRNHCPSNVIRWIKERFGQGGSEG